MCGSARRRLAACLPRRSSPVDWVGRSMASARKHAGHTAMASQTKTSTSELAWDHAVLDIPERGIKEQREATPEERAHIARALELAGCAALKAEYTVKPSLDGRYRV